MIPEYGTFEITEIVQLRSRNSFSRLFTQLRLNLKNMLGYENLRIEDFEKANWLSVFDYVQIPHCRHFSREFELAAKSALEQDDSASASALKFIEEITEIHFNPEHADNPFKAFFRGGDYRSLIPSDLTEHEVELIRELSKNTPSPELRARFRDILWIVVHDYTSGRLAATDYLESAKLLDDATDLEFACNVERGIQLAAMLGKNDLLPQYTLEIESLIEAQMAKHKYVRAMELLETCFDQRLQDPEKISQNLEIIADYFQNTNNYYLGHIALDLLAKSYSRSKQPEKRTATREREAKLHVDEADERALKGDFLVASDVVMKAIQVLKTIKSGSEYQLSLEQKLQTYQERSIENMVTTTSTITITDNELEEYRSAVRGYSLIEALTRMARCLRVYGKKDMQEQYERTHEGLVFQRIFGTHIVTKSGSIVGRIPPVNFNASQEEEEEREIMHLYQEGAINRHFHTIAIEAMRDEIYVSHHPSERDFLFIIQNHPFIESGHELIWAKALAAGMNDDRIVCAHLLIPQIESSFRLILRQNGISTTKLNSDDTQDEMMLGGIFSEYKELLIRILGEPMYFNLRGLLITKYSTNLRNLALHGLMGDRDFESLEITYLWWLALRIILSLVRLPNSTQSVPDNQTAPQNNMEEITAEIRETGSEPSENVPFVESEIQTTGFRKKLWGPSDGNWHIFLENVGAELTFDAAVIDNPCAVLTTVPRLGLKVRKGGHIDIFGYMENPPSEENINPQGLVPFTLTLTFSVEWKKYSQKLISIRGLSKDLTVSPSIEEET